MKKGLQRGIKDGSGHGPRNGSGRKDCNRIK